MPRKKKNGSSKNIWREPTEDDPRRRIFRKPEEQRIRYVSLRLTETDYLELYRYAKSYKTTMAYLLRDALQEKYSHIFSSNLNRYIREPRKKPIQLDPPTQLLHSYVDGTTKIFDNPDDDVFVVDDEDDID